MNKKFNTKLFLYLLNINIKTNEIITKIEYLYLYFIDGILYRLYITCINLFIFNN